MHQGCRSTQSLTQNLREVFDEVGAKALGSDESGSIQFMSLEVLAEEYEVLSSIFPEEVTSARPIIRRT